VIEHLPERETTTVRPYLLTGGRTRPAGRVFPVEALVRATGESGAALPAEMQRILDLTGSQYLSIAELSAHVHVPVGVIRVLVDDLRSGHLVSVHGLPAAQAGLDPALTLGVLESVLDGISAL
jgi:hypothetical protein